MLYLGKTKFHPIESFVNVVVSFEKASLIFPSNYYLKTKQHNVIISK